MTSHPPTSGPITNAIPVHAVQVPIAAPRSSPLNVDVIVASAAGVSSAPATPCSARATISDVPVPGQRAQERRRAERDHADQEHAPLAEQVAERAADEDQRPERQQVRVHDPLLEGEPAAEVALDRGQRDVDDGRVDEHDRRPEDASRRASAVCASLRSDRRYLQNSDGEAAMAGYTIKRLEDVPDVLGDYPARCGCSAPTRLGTGVVHAPPHAAAHGRQGLLRPLPPDAGGDLLRRPRNAALQARRRGDRRGARARRSGSPREVVRSVWNDEPEEAHLVIVSARLAEPPAGPGLRRGLLARLAAAQPSVLASGAAPRGRCAGRARGTAPARADPRRSRRRTPRAPGRA